MPRDLTPAQRMIEAGAPAFGELVADLAERVYLKQSVGGIVGAIEAAIWEDATVVDLVARSRIIQRAGVLSGEFAEAPALSLPRVPFGEAVDNLLGRTPKLAEPVITGGPRYLQVQRMYQEGLAFAVAKSVEQHVTEQIQDLLKTAAEQGTRTLDVQQFIADIREWGKGYAENVWRTNMNTATTAATMGMLQDPDIAAVIPALRYTAVGGSRGDGSTRDSHARMNGTLAPPDHRIWDERSTPAGYNCRCTLDFVDRFKLQQLNRIDANGRVKVVIPNPGVRADPGFGHRPHFGMGLVA